MGEVDGNLYGKFSLQYEPKFVPCKHSRNSALYIYIYIPLFISANKKATYLETR